MMRPIDADAIRFEYGGLMRIPHYDYRRIAEYFAEQIKQMPTIEERKTGRWIRHPEQKNIYGGKCVECSECGEKYMVQYIEDEKFCRNCGADMRGEQDGNA